MWTPPKTGGSVSGGEEIDCHPCSDVQFCLRVRFHAGWELRPRLSSPQNRSVRRSSRNIRNLSNTHHSVVVPPASELQIFDVYTCRHLLVFQLSDSLRV